MVVRPWLNSLKQWLGMQGSLTYPQQVMAESAASIYLCITYQVDYDKFIAECGMTDVMSSFCVVTFLHTWMVSVALMKFGESGTYCKQMLIECMWMDIEKRARKIGMPMNKKIRKESFTKLNGQFRAVFYGMDEGLLSDDTVLAGALWRHILDSPGDISEFAVLGKLVDYVRRQVVHLETNISQKDFLRFGIVSLVGFGEEKCEHAAVRHGLNRRIKDLKDFK